MAVVAFQQADLNRLLAIARELHDAGRIEEGAAVARALAVLNDLSGPEISDADEDLDPEFIRDMEEAEKDIAAGRLIPHEVVLERFRSLNNGRDPVEPRCRARHVPTVGP
jgi:hypothetical protein